MEKFVRQTLLFDFYGDLLTDHQRKVYDDVICQDLSYSEAATELGVSRQGVHDLIRRCDRQLQEYEDKLHLVEKFVAMREQIGQIRAEAEAALEKGSCVDPGKIISLCESLLEEM